MRRFGRPLRNLNCKYLVRIPIQSVSILIVFLSLFSGCSFLPAPNTFLKENFEKYHIKRVAILPFYNNTSIKNAGKVVAKAFVEQLYDYKNLEVEFPGNIRRLLIEERIIIRKGMGSDHIKLIGKRLNVDAIIIGWIEKYDVGGGKRDTRIPIVSVNARMVHTKSCSVLWIGQNKRRGDDYITIFDYGQISSVAALARKVVHELIETIP